MRVPGFPIEYYDKQILWSIGASMAKFDAITLKGMSGMENDYYVPERGKFARLCVEIDLRKILRS